jgi:hypothetical protein
MDVVGESRFYYQLRTQSSARVFTSILQRKGLSFEDTEQVLVHKLHVACDARFFDVARGLIDFFDVDVNAAFRLLGTDDDESVMFGEDGEEEEEEEDEEEPHDKSPLYRICEYAHCEKCFDFAMKMLDDGADVNFICGDNTTPLQVYSLPTSLRPYVPTYLRTYVPTLLPSYPPTLLPP